MTEEYSIDISIKEIQVNRFVIVEPGWSTTEYVGTLGIARAIEVARHEPRVYVRLVIRAFLEPTSLTDEVDRTDLGMLDVTCVYEIEGIERFERTSTQVGLPAMLATRLLYDAYLTSRGIWHARTMGTIANAALLPFVDASVLYNSMESIDGGIDLES